MQEREHSLRKRLDARLLKLVAPVGMSIAEYTIACNLDGIDPSVENGQFLHWIITADGENDITKKVHSTVLKSLEKKYLLDLDDNEQCSYFCDAVVDVVLKDKWWAKSLLEVVLENYKGTEVFDFCKRLNKGLGLTSIEYLTK